MSSQSSTATQSIEIMHRGPVTGCLHYGTQADCTLNACTNDRQQAYADRIRSHSDLAARSCGGR